MVYFKSKGSKILTLALSIVLIGAGLVYFNVSGASFGFEKNIEVRKGADADSVAGCMLSCENMLAGWLEMNPSSPNYTRQGEKIEAKAQQCLGINELAGFPFSEAEILASCGLEPQPGPECVEIPPEISINEGACGDLSFIEEANLPQCCTTETPRRIDCGADQEWVVGIAAFPTCYIPDS